MSTSWNSSPAASGGPPVGPYVQSNQSNSDSDPPPPAPPPKTFRTSASPYMRQSPTLSTSSSAGSSSGGHTWSKPIAQPFINGRGMVQPVAAPRAFQVNPPPIAQPSSQPPRGQQAYVRTAEPPFSAAGVASESGNPSPTISFPSAFGTRQRVAIKSSRPQFGRGAGRAGAAVTSRQYVDAREDSGPAQVVAQSSPNLLPPSTASSSGRASPQFDSYRWQQPSASGEDARGVTTLAPRSTSPALSTTPALESVLGAGDWNDDTHSVFTPQPSRADRSHSPSPLPSPASHSTSILHRPRPKTPDPFAGSGSFSSRPHQSGQSHRASLSTGPPSDDRALSPAPSVSSTSILDRPRPKTPDPYASYPSSSTGHSPVALLKTQSSGAGPSPSYAAPSRPSMHRADSSPSVATGPPPFGYAQAQDRQRNGSVIDRPRPKTPDSGAVFALGSRAGGGGAGWGELPPARPKTPDTGAVFAFGVEGHEDRSRTAASRERERHGSVLDRPRPRTPDSQAWLDQAPVPRHKAATSNAGRYSFSNAPLDVDVKPSRIPLSSPPLSSANTPPTFPTVTSIPAAAPTHHSTIPHPSQPAPPPPFNPNRTSIDSHRTRTDSNQSEAPLYRRSSESTRSNHPSPGKATTAQHATGRSRFASVGAAPMLRLDLDLGGSDTMFDIASLLKAGGGGGAGLSPVKREFGEVDRTERSKDLPLPKGLPIASRPVVGISGARKEPPKVDLALELELEIDKAIPLNRPIVEEEEPPESPPTRMVEMSPSRRGSAEQDHPGPAPAKRRKSLASLLSFGSSSKDDLTGPIRANRSSDSLSAMGRPSVDLSRPSIESSARSYSPDPNMSTMSTSTSAASGLSQSQSSYQSHATYSSATTAGTATTSRGKRPSVATLDKSLPPTPPSHTPTTPTNHRARQASLALAAAAATSSMPTSSTAHPASGGSPSGNTDSPTKGALGRQLSKLRHRNASHSGASTSSQSATSSSGFQFVSGSSTRKGTSFSFGSGRTASSQGYGEPSSVSSNGHAHSSSTGSTSSTAAFGKRLVGRFGGGSGGGSSSSTSAAKVSNGPSFISPTSIRTTSDADDSADNTMHSNFSVESPTPTKQPRRASFSNLLGQSRPTVGGDAGSGRLAILGMSLPAARKSEDLLTRKPAREVEEEQAQRGQRRPPLIGRQSFDLLTERTKVPRRPSTDDLLSLATAKLAALNTDDAPPPPRVSEDSYTSSPPSNVSTSSLDLEHDHAQASSTAIEAPPVLATATRVVRSASTTSLDPSAASASAEHSPILSRTATPQLIRSDSLQRSGSRNTLLSARASTVQGPGSDGGHGSASGDHSSEGTPKASGSPVQGRKRNKIPDSGVGSDSSMSSAWLDLEDSLGLYSTAVSENRLDRGSIVVNTLLPFLRREEDSPAQRTEIMLARRQRQVLFGWLSTLTTELREMQPTHRGACLEAVAAISESHFLSAAVLQGDEEGQSRYRMAIVKVLAFAVEKLNDKAVYANTLVFSGRIFALAFFRIEGVALKLLRALPPVKRPCLKRVLEEIGVNEHQLPPVNLKAFPSHLWSLCLRDLRSYTTLLLPANPRAQSADDSYLVQDGDLSVEMSGNWLIRWTASDSDLPFAFYRAYHRQLAAHLIPFDDREDIANEPLLAPSAVITAPGCLFLAASLLEKSDALVHRNLRSVTSIGPNNSNFNTNDSANLSFGQKPKILELANRRLVQTMLDIVGGPPVAPGDQADAAPDSETRRHTFSRMLRVWIRACVKKTSMWDTRSVFILLDLIEGLIYTLSYPAPSASRGSEEEVPVPRPHESCIDMFDIPFIFSFVKIILSTADNTVTIMRTVAFIYAHFEIFTLRPADRDELCEHIILDEVLFPRLYLHWNAGVRGYFIRLLVWRLSRLGIVDAEQHPDRPRDPRILALFGLMNIRLETIRKRHDELEPLDNLTDDDLFKPKRSTICSTRGVKEAPFTVDELVGMVNEDSEGEEQEDEYEEPQEYVQSAPNGASNGAVGGKKGGLKDVATVARVVSWLKGGLGKNSKNKSSSNRGTVMPPSRIDPFILGNLPESPSAQLDDPTEAMETSMLSASHDDSVDSSWTSASLPTSTSEYEAEPTINVVDTSSERRIPRPNSPAFFAFDFENGLAPRAAEAEANAVESSNGGGGGVDGGSDTSTIGSGDTVFPRSPLRRTNTLDPHGVVSPRVSLRFSKRISILPPAALDMLKESGEAVPPIPAQYRETASKVYDRKLHPYAIRGLRDYEDALDEWTDWVARLQEEEDDGKKVNRGFVDTVPRLAVSWPASFEEGA